MKYLFTITLLLFGFLLSAQTRYDVSTETEFKSAQDLASAGDTIAWMPGIYMNVRQDIDKDSLIITAIPFGSVLFSGASRAVINADHIVFSGFQYIGGVIGSLDIINVYGKDILISQINIQNYTSRKYLIVHEESRRTTISHCNFENRLNLDDQNILSILVDDQPGYHKIQHCSFKNFDGTGNDLGIEPIRIGVSSQGDLDSRTLVEYCYFTQCNGDGEIISHKSRQNVYRYNTFESNPVAELVLRHGDEGIIYGNFFLNNMGGIRVREGSDHYIFNNYFQDLDRRAIYLQNDPSDPLSNIHIYHNTIINSEEIILGGSGSNPPSNVIIANNVFANPIEKLFVEETGSESWISNIYFGNLGIAVTATGLIDQDPLLIENTNGFFQPQADSPTLSAAGTGYPSVPLYPEMVYDHEISLDLMKKARPEVLDERSIGASEFSTMTNVNPHATELSTGPTYLFDDLVKYIAANVSQLYISGQGDSRSFHVSSNIDWTIVSGADWISTDISSGFGDGNVELNIEPNADTANRAGILTIIGGEQSLIINIFQDAASGVNIQEEVESQLLLFPNPSDGMFRLSNLPQAIERSQIEVYDVAGQIIFSQKFKNIGGDIDINLESLFPGTYLVNIQFISHNGNAEYEVQRSFVRY